MPTITVQVDDDLKDRMEQYPELNWSEVTRQAIREKIDDMRVLERMDRIAADSQADREDVEEIADLVDTGVRMRFEERYSEAFEDEADDSEEIERERST